VYAPHEYDVVTFACETTKKKFLHPKERKRDRVPAPAPSKGEDAEKTLKLDRMNQGRHGS